MLGYGAVTPAIMLILFNRGTRPALAKSVIRDTDSPSVTAPD
jgi:hypothetical protein